MKYICTEAQVDVPENVKVGVKARKVTVEGPLGKIEKTFKHVAVDIFR